jgi:hypothetical protein
MKKICIYCSSRDSISPMMLEEARQLGEKLGAGSYDLIYGGAETGAMGAVANGAQSTGCRVTGIFPKKDLKHEKPHPGLSEMIYVDSMWERKQRLVQESDGFIVFPGGTGTLDEFFEVLVLRQLSDSTGEESIVFNKPIVVLNLFGYWDPLLEMIQIYSTQGFIDPGVHEHYHIVDSVDSAIETLNKTWGL